MMRPKVTRGVLLAVVTAAAAWMACGKRPDPPGRLQRMASSPSRTPPYQTLLSKYPRGAAVDLSTHQDYRTVRIGPESRAARLVWVGEAREMRLDVPQYPARLQLWVAAVGGNVEYAVDITAANGRPRRVDWGAALDRWRRVDINLSGYVGQRITVTFHSLITEEKLLIWTDPVIVPEGRDETRPDVILISLDTTRLDQLSSYVPDAAPMPVLDALAREGVRFDAAISTSSWTMPAHASIFTGRYPVEHWAVFGGGRLEPPEVTLAEVFQRAGYKTLGISGGPFTDSPWGFQQGFDLFVDSVGSENAASATDQAIAWLRRTSGAPAFVFINYFDPHNPIEVPADLQSSFDVPQWLTAEVTNGLESGDVAWTGPIREALVRGYRAELVEVDRHLERLLRTIQDERRWDNTLVIVVGDHGELLGEHDQYGHGYTLEEELIRVPLIIKPAGDELGDVKRYTDQIQTTDLFTLTQALADLPNPEGTKLSEAIARHQPVRVVTYAEEHHEPVPEATVMRRWRSRGLWAARTDRVKVVVDADGRTTFYRLKDPIGEIATASVTGGEQLLAEVERFRQQPTRRALSPTFLLQTREEMERLRTLGYVR